MVGQVLSIRYEVTAALFDGPIFATFAAKDRMQNRDVCIKVFKQPYSGEKDFVDACVRFAARAAVVQHPGLEKVMELDDHEGMPYLVGDLAKGSVLRERIRRFAPFSVPVSVSTAIAICEPLLALHKGGIVHGDICAENVLMGTDGNAVLLQGGLWQAYGHSQTAGMVALPGMAPYLAPEVSAGGMPSPESDVYSVGVLLFELLTGHTPFRAETPVALALKHAAGSPPRVRALNSSVPMVLDEIVSKALAKDPDQRYHSIGDLLSDMRYLQDALRFGRSLSWPIRPEALPDLQPVAPRMSAVRVEAKPKPKPKEPIPADDEPVSDVPAWMRFGVAFVAAMLVFFVGWWVVTSLSPAKDVKVPNILHTTFSEAAGLLNDSGLKLVMRKREPSDKYSAETIIDVEPAPGETVRQGGTVFAVVSSGSRFVEVPDLRDMTLDEARTVLGKLNLVLDERVVEQRSRTIKKGNVISQKPAPREQLEQSRTVHLLISSGDDEPRNGAAPEESVLYSYSLNIRVVGVGTQEPVLLRVDMVDDDGPQTILEEQHYDGDVVSVVKEGRGKEVYFKIYYNGELRKQETMKPEQGERVE